MARIDDLINEIGDERVRKAIADEVKKLRENKKFGLVFENHVPELSYLYSVPVKKGSSVVKRGAKGAEVYRVQSVGDGEAVIVRDVEGVQDAETVGVNELVLVKRYGEAIYPALLPVDSVTKNESKPYHTLINSDNYHALQLLLYCYEGKFDVIYIDPPYNTGARDWKYNNNYVDSNDQWRHSKWLAMMKKRLVLAKRLLKPDGSIIIAIDDYEVNHLGIILEEIFAGFTQDIIVVNHHPQGAGSNTVSRTHEYAYVCTPNNIGLKGRKEAESTDNWSLQRSGQGENNWRRNRWRQFFAIHVNPETREVIEVGEEIPLTQTNYPRENTDDGLIRIYPIDRQNRERVWRYNRATMTNKIREGKIIYTERGSLKVKPDSVSAVPIFSVWTGARYNAGVHGSSLLTDVMGESNTFPYPKSVWTVLDMLSAVVGNSQDALILDFFAGSGTTLNATCLLNADDDGNRCCILVTNNEVDEEKTRQLNRDGIFAGNPEFEKHGIAESVTFPRCKYVINGKRDDGTPLPGKYLNDREMSEGFDENLAYFKLDFLDPHQVALKTQFQAVLPILWLMAGAKGKLELTDGRQPFYIPDDSPFAVLLKESRFAEFNQAIAGREDLTHVFLVTDSEDAFRQMSEELNCECEKVMLYKNYLDNFRLNVEREI